MTWLVNWYYKRCEDGGKSEEYEISKAVMHWKIGSTRADKETAQDRRPQTTGRVVNDPRIRRWKTGKKTGASKGSRNHGQQRLAARRNKQNRSLYSVDDQ